MLLFIYGENTYSIAETLQQLIERYEKGRDLRQIQCKEESSEAFWQELQMPSLFARPMLFVLKDVFNWEQELLAQKEALHQNNHIVICVHEGKVEAKSALYKFLAKEAQVQECVSLNEVQIRTWIQKSTKKKIEKGAVDVLMSEYGTDQWGLQQGISRAVAFVGKRSNITEDDVRVFARPSIETNIFNTIDAIGQRKRKHALQLLQEHLDQGEAPAYVLSMLAYQFRNMLEVKDLVQRGNTMQEIIEQSSAKPFAVKKSYAAAQLFSLEELKRVYRRLFEAELAIKTGKAEPSSALRLFVVGV